MTRFRISALTGLLAGTLFALACGNVASTGQVRKGDDGGGATSGDGGASGDGGTSSPGGAAGSSGASGESDAAGAAGATGGTSSGGTPGSGGFRATDAGPTCRVPQVTPVPNPTPEQTQRAALIHDYCVTLVRDNCLDHIGGQSFIYQQARGCSTEGKISACELDRLYEYAAQIEPACDNEWQATIRCMAAQSFTTLALCTGAGLFGTPPTACGAEQSTLLECTSKNSTWKHVTGAKAKCDYSTSNTLKGCEIACSFDNYKYNFLSLCGGPAGLPLRCSCLVNGQELGDVDWQISTFYPNNCADAAQRIADGEWCINRLDCCLEWTEGDEKRCECGSEAGCAQAAESRGASRVEKCPKYDFVH